VDSLYALPFISPPFPGAFLLAVNNWLPALRYQVLAKELGKCLKTAMGCWHSADPENSNFHWLSLLRIYCQSNVGGMGYTGMA
jgi:hypothetical protein